MRSPLPLAVVLVLLAGCGGGSSAGTGGSTAATTTGSVPSASTPSGTPSEVVITDDGTDGTFTASPPGPVPTGTAPATGPARGAATPIPVLSAVRVAAQPGFDRVVLEFDGPVPGYRVEYVPQIVEDARGEPVEVAGTAFLQLVLQAATLNDAPQGGTRKYTGPQRVTPRLAAVQEVVVSGDFEAVLSLGVGVTGRRAFRVSALTGPSRIVLDVANG